MEIPVIVLEEKRCWRHRGIVCTIHWSTVRTVEELTESRRHCFSIHYINSRPPFLIFNRNNSKEGQMGFTRISYLEPDSGCSSLGACTDRSPILHTQMLSDDSSY